MYSMRFVNIFKDHCCEAHTCSPFLCPHNGLFVIIDIVDTHGQARGTRKIKIQTSFDLNPGDLAIPHTVISFPR